MKALKMRVKILQSRPDDLQAMLDVSNSCERISDLAIEADDLKLARQSCEKEIEMRKKIFAQAPNDFESLHNLGAAYYRLGGLASAEGDLKLAKECYELALKAYKRSPRTIRTTFTRCASWAFPTFF